MKVLLVGSGAREHALAWRLKQSPRLTRLWVADGNAGTASIATNLPVKPDDVDGIVEAARTLGIDLVVVGPEQPLANGIVDRLNAPGIPAFGPTRAASQLEASKGFALEVMREAGVPCPEFRVFREQQEALDWLESHTGPVVVKADGLAAGKGVSMCATAEEASAAVRACMGDRIFGIAGDTVVIQELLTGPEVSVFAFSDGQHLSSLAAACDYKRLEDGDQGPNTGGMGSFTPPDFWNHALAEEIARTVMRPVVETMSRQGTPYTGVLYAGLMLTSTGPKVLEFNCRFGDPETQVVLPQLATDPLEVMSACVDGRLDQVPITWESNCYVGVVMASGGYPAAYETGFEIDGLDGEDRSTMIFHAATRQAADGAPGRLLTSGGRVLTVVGRGESLAEARARAYDRVREIRFYGAQYRTDIAALEQQKGRKWTTGQIAPGG
jgi:phosphoribosylamine--glycine ligase